MYVDQNRINAAVQLQRRSMCRLSIYCWVMNPKQEFVLFVCLLVCLIFDAPLPLSFPPPPFFFSFFLFALILYTYDGMVHIWINRGVLLRYIYRSRLCYAKRNETRKDFMYSILSAQYCSSTRCGTASQPVSPVNTKRRKKNKASIFPPNNLYSYAYKYTVESIP